MGIFKGTYRGRGIYWHGHAGYGDETNATHRTMAECRAAIDRQMDVERTPAEKHWADLTPDVRQRYRADRRVWDHPDGAKGVAYDDVRTPGKF